MGHGRSRTDMRRPLFVTLACVAGVGLLTVPHRRAPSIEQLFVAETQAASNTDATCTMPTIDDDGQEQRLAIPTAADTSGDLPPVRMVVDPYPSCTGGVGDCQTDLAMNDHTHRKRLPPHKPTAGSPTSLQPAMPVQQIMGPATGIGFGAGVAMDAAHRELFTVNNDVEDRMVVFDYDDRGNVKPKRLLYVPHQSWGIAFNRKRD